MREYCVTVTYECNWDCGYCSADTHNQKPLDENAVQSYIDAVEPGSVVTLTGGEPGMLSEAAITRILTTLKDKNCRIQMNTNGLFFQRYKDLVGMVDSFVYHCSFDLRNKVWQPEGHETMDIEYITIVTDDTYDRIPSFLEKNVGLKIGLEGADKYFVGGKVGDVLSFKNRIKLYQNYRDHLRENFAMARNLAATVEKVGCVGVTVLSPKSCSTCQGK